MRNPMGVLMFFLIALSLTGCESIPKKFIRKKIEPQHKPAVVFLDEGNFQKKYSNEYYYKTHYTLWKSWHDDMGDDLTGGNSKRLTRSAEEAYSHLEQMHRYLNPQKQKELSPYLQELRVYMKKFQDSSYSRGEASSMKSDLERIKRLVANGFYYEKIKSDLLADNVDLGSA